MAISLRATCNFSGSQAGLGLISSQSEVSQFDCWIGDRKQVAPSQVYRFAPVEAQPLTGLSRLVQCVDPIAGAMAQPWLFPAGLLGRDASHRTRKLDTHLTHGCMQHFRQFSSGGSDVNSARGFKMCGFPAFFEPLICLSLGTTR